MNQIHYTPVNPGEVIKDELDEIGLTQSALAKHIGVLPKTINEICRGKRGISAEMAMKLSKALGGSPPFSFLCPPISDLRPLTSDLRHLSSNLQLPSSAPP